MIRGQILVVLASVLPACALSERVPVDDPDEVSTRDLSIMLRVDGRSEGTTVTVQLGSPVGPLHLAATDRVAFGPLELAADLEDGRPVYVARSGAIGGILDLVIDRARDEDVRRSITVPPLPTVTEPSAEVSRGAPVSVAWKASSGTHVTRLRVSGVCIETLVRELAFEGGTYVVAAGDLAPRDGAGERCPLTFAIERTVTVSSGVYGVVQQIGARTVESSP